LVLNYVNQLNPNDLATFNTNFQMIQTSITKLTNAINTWNAGLTNLLKLGSQTQGYDYMVRQTNDQMMSIDRVLASTDGLFNRPWYKNVYVAPGSQTGYAPEVFPGLMDAIRVNNINNVVYSLDQLIKAFDGITQLLLNTVGIFE